MSASVVSGVDAPRVLETGEHVLDPGSCSLTAAEVLGRWPAPRSNASGSGRPLSSHTTCGFGVAKHLKNLEAAGMVIARKQGRERLHFLNAVPIAEIYDRWVSRFSVPWTASLVELKAKLEETVQKVFEIYIKTNPERLWRALTDPAERAKYQFGLTFEPALREGEAYQAIGDGRRVISGETLEFDPPRRLVQTYNGHWRADIAAYAPSRVTIEIERVGDSCRVTLIHDDLAEDASPEIYGGWPMILSGLKTLIETGDLLTTPGSLRWGHGEVRR